MKREIKFRGKIASENLEELISCEIEIPHKNGWVEGSFVEPNIITGRVADIDWDYFATEWWAKVIPETVGQFTGLKDKNGIEVYEGDLIRVVSDPDKPIHEVYFDNEMLEFGLRNSFELFHCQFGDNFEVIGNIHDNPELLK